MSSNPVTGQLEHRPRAAALVGLGLVAGTTLALQILLTRVFSAELFYHFSFLAVSLGLLGVGGGAILVYVRPAWFDGALSRRLVTWTLVYAALLPVCTFVLVRLDFTYTGLSGGFLLTLVITAVLAWLPFTAAGIVVALFVRGYAKAMGRVYASDLLGAGIGAGMIVPLMWWVDSPTLIVALAVVAAIAAVLMSAGERRARTAAIGGVLIAAALVVVSLSSSMFYLKPVGPKPTADRWTPLSRILGYELANRQGGFVIYDKVIGEVIPYTRGAPYPTWRKTQEGPASIGYQLTGPGTTAIIGGGGGRDIITALSERQKVDVIELNHGIRDVVDKDLGDLSGAPYTLPGVHTIIADGRSALARSSKKYDTVHIGFTDTFSANSGQAYALTESNLYTVEAFKEYLDRLGPKGILNVSRPVRHSGLEAMRITGLALTALKQEGVQHPERNVVVILGRYKAPFRTFIYGTVLARKTPYTAAELTRIRALAAARGLGVAYAPGGPYVAEWKTLHAAPSFTSYCERAALDLCPPTDDRPFFFFMTRFGNVSSPADNTGYGSPIAMLLVTLGILVVLALLSLVVPVVLVRDQKRPSVGDLSFFGAIGVGFLLLEVVLIQRFVLFLGFPTYALSVVLCALLLSTGVGAWLTTRLDIGERRMLVTALSLALGAIVIAAVALQPVLRALIDLSFPVRLLLSVALIAPLGAVLGMAMPIGIRRLVRVRPNGVAWAWGINGIASVVASVLAVIVAIYWGFTVATLLAALCYAGALVHALVARWPAEPDPGGSEPLPSDIAPVAAAAPAAAE